MSIITEFEAEIAKIETEFALDCKKISDEFERNCAAIRDRLDAEIEKSEAEAQEARAALARLS